MPVLELPVIVRVLQYVIVLNLFICQSMAAHWTKQFQTIIQLSNPDLNNFKVF